ncbi:MAG: hypothetical protein KDI29_01815, partial [Pseudomonadales bacterium]|nr:hypothetical protein [Pseudomonadales bacterium]
MKLLFSNPVSFAAAARRHRGINPPDHKQASLRSVLMDMPLPRLLYFPLCLTGKEPAYPLVKPGYSVLKGQLLAASTDGNDNLVHASTSGRIVALASHPRPDPFGSNGETLILEADGEDRWIALHPATDWQTLPATEIRSRICRAGIDERNDCGLSRWNHARQPEILIINALETEPYLTADQALIRSHAKELLTGAGILQLACGALRCIIAITSEKSDAIAALYTALQESGQQAGIEVMVLPPRYPITDRQLIDAVTGGRVPVEQPESERGAVLADVTTTMAVRDAVIDGRPMLSRVTTVCGNTLRTPKNFRALLGTPVGFLLELCGIDYQ